MSDLSYPNVQLFIDGRWVASEAKRTIPVVNPATGSIIGTVAHAGQEDLERALAAADRGFALWRRVSAFDRYKVMRKAADILREREALIAPLMTWSRESHSMKHGRKSGPQRIPLTGLLRRVGARTGVRFRHAQQVSGRK